MITSAAEFIQLVHSESNSESYHRARHDAASLEVWHDVINSHPDMRVWVVLNKSAPLEILSILATDPDERVRGAVSTTRRISPEILEVLSHDTESSIRRHVALHQKCPFELVRLLANDADPFVSEVAKLRLQQWPAT